MVKLSPHGDGPAHDAVLSNGCCLSRKLRRSIEWSGKFPFGVIEQADVAEFRPADRNSLPAQTTRPNNAD
jgi:hypothetical protein